MHLLNAKESALLAEASGFRTDNLSMRVFTRYDEKASTNESNTFYRHLAMSHVSEICHEPTRRYLLDCLIRRDFRLLCDFDPPYGELTPSDAYSLRQCQAFFSKRADVDFGIDRRVTAERSFLQAENLCRETNSLFRSWNRGHFQFDRDVESVLFRAQRKISQILGDVPRLEDLKFRFGPGATTQRQKKDASPRYKLGDALSCSEAFLPLASEFLAEFPLWMGHESEEDVTKSILIEDGRVSFVPKSWKTDRAIVVEPMLNTMFQLGIGDYIAQRLRNSGIDIRDQSRNRSLARYASITGALATLDLSSASDTISKELVAHLLPLDWFTFLSFGRTPCVTLNGVRIRQEKFSSMGNGFTFPLETLIFYALSVSCFETAEERKFVSVYGDDIIVPVTRVRLVMKALNACGFVLGKGKSFWSGSFRESCGKDYLSGIDIRPYFARDKVSCESLFQLHNFYYRNYDFKRARLCLRFMAKSVTLFGPDGYGDGHLLGDWRPRPHKRKLGYGGYTFETYRLGPRHSVKVSSGDYVFPSYSVYVSGSQNDPGGPVLSERQPSHSYMKGLLSVTLPGTKGYKRIKIYTFSN